MYEAKVMLDSMAPSGHRLTTILCTYPEFVHNELMTHRDFSRNSGSSRAIPGSKVRRSIMTDPVMPIYWGTAQKGMQPGDALDIDLSDRAAEIWLKMRDACVGGSKELDELGVHKQYINRPLQPWKWMTTLVSATRWSNFFALRCDPMAQAEIQRLAYDMRDRYGVYIEPPSLEFIKLSLLLRDVWEMSIPTNLESGQWHMPFITTADHIELADKGGYESPSIAYLRKVSTGRCARLSYLTHLGVRDLNEDARLHDDLVAPGHWSPFEHVAMAHGDSGFQSGNFRGWDQYRKMFAGECR